MALLSKYIPVGTKVIALTHTHFFIGKLVEAGIDGVVLSHASWIADLGRFEDTLRTGNIPECEPVPAISGLPGVPRGIIIPMNSTGVALLGWPHPLPGGDK